MRYRMRQMHPPGGWGRWVWVPGALATIVLVTYVLVALVTQRDLTRFASSLGRVRLLAQRVEIAAGRERRMPDGQLRVAISDLESQNAESRHLAEGMLDAPDLTDVMAASEVVIRTARQRADGSASATELTQAVERTVNEVDTALNAIAEEHDTRLAYLIAAVASGAIVIAAGTVLTMLALAASERRLRRAARAREADNRRTRQILEASPNPILSVHPGGAVQALNEAALRLHGASRRACTGATWDSIVSADDLESLRIATAAVIDRGERVGPIPVRVHLEDQRIVQTEAYAAPLLTDAARQVLVEFVDVTARLEAERELASMLESTPLATITIDGTGTIARANPAVQRIFGWAPEELRGQPVHRLVAVPHDALHRPYMETYLATGRASTPEGLVIHRSREVVARRRSGETFPAELTVNEFATSGGEHRFIGVVQDISDRKRQEQETLVAEKNAAMATLLSGVAHDFNNLLTVIGGGLEVARAEPHAADPWLERASTATDRATQLVAQLLQYSRPAKGDLVPVDLAAMTEETVRLLRETVDRRVRIDVHAESGLPPVSGDLSRLQQVVMNLLLNAAHAVTQRLDRRVAGYEPRIEVSVAAARSTADAAGAVLTIRDNGDGMAPAVLQRVFDPFFTTKRVGEGTGLGLSTSYAAVTAHGGHISADSIPEQGATFTVRLPFARAGVPPTHAAPPHTDAAPAGRTILVAEDEPAISAYVERVLVQAGYRVTLAADGAEALRRFDEQTFDAVLLDLNMPGARGYDVLERIRLAVPRQRVLVMSGHGDRGDALARGAAGFLQKPFVGDDLLRVLDEAMPGP